MTMITLTEAITEVVFGHRMALEAVNEREIATEEKWCSDFIALKKAAELAAANVGYDLAYFQANPAYLDASPNLLLRPISIPQEVAAFFTAGVQRAAEIRAEDGDIASASRAIIEGARAGHFDVWGHFDGLGRPEQIPAAALRDLWPYWKEQRDCLFGRNTDAKWTSVSFPLTQYESRPGGSTEPRVLGGKVALTFTTDLKLIRLCMRKIYKAVKEQSVKPPNVGEVIGYVNAELEKLGKQAKVEPIKKVAAEAEFYEQRLKQGKRPVGLKPLSELKIIAS